jgi:hypothetical protein
MSLKMNTEIPKVLHILSLMLYTVTDIFLVLALLRNELWYLYLDVGDRSRQQLNDFLFAD